MLPTPKPRNGTTVRWRVRQFWPSNGETSARVAAARPATVLAGKSAGGAFCRWVVVGCFALVCLASAPSAAQRLRQQPSGPARAAAPQQRRPAAQQPPTAQPKSETGAESTSAESAAPPVGSVEALAAQVTQPKLESAAKEAAADADLGEEQKRRVAERYAAAIADIERAEQLDQRAQNFGKLNQDANERAEAAQTKLEELSDAEPQAPKNDDVIGLEAELAKLQTEFEALKKAKLELDDQATRRAARRNDIRQRLADLDSDLATAKQEANAAPVATDPPSLTTARQNAALSRLRVLLSEKPALQSELALFDAEAALNLLQIERGLNARRLTLLEQQLEVTREALARVRAEAAGSAVADAVRQESQVPLELRPIAEQTRQFAERNQELTEAIQALDTNRQEIGRQLDDLRKKLNQAKAKVESVGLSASIGAMLRKVRTELPDSSDLRAAAKARRTPIDDAQLAIFDLDERRDRLANLDQAAVTALQELPQPVQATDELLAATKQLLTVQAEILDKLYRSQSSYFDTLVDTSIKEEQLAQLSDEFLQYIEQRVLWIRSHPPLTRSTLADLRTAGAMLRTAVDSPALSVWLLKDASDNPFVYAIAAFIALLLLLARPHLHRWLLETAEQARSRAYSHFAPSLTACAVTVVASLFGPFLFGFLALRLHVIQDRAPLALALAHGCRLSALILLPLGFFRRVFAVNGLAEAHFDWSRFATAILRRNLSWIGLIFIPLVLLTGTASELQSPGNAGIVYRCLCLASCLILGVFIWRIFHPRNGLPRDYLRQHEGGWVERLQPLWFWGLVAYPVALGVMVVMGYVYSARELCWRGFISVCAVGIIYILHGLTMRLLLVLRRNISIALARQRFDDYKKKRAEQQAQAKQKSAASGTQPAKPGKVIADLPGVSVTADGVVVEEDPLADLRANTAQTRRLLNTVFLAALVVTLWFTWRDVLPALTLLERWPLWNAVTEVTETVTVDGVSQTRSRDVLDPVTIADLLLAIVVAIVGCIAARDLPGFLELTVLKRLPLENSVRYAITTLGRYALIFLAFFVFGKMIGLRWQQIQWMATALTFGLAFGLQEMFANFVAGVIILFEQPIRVGDIVTIDTVTGAVARIQMRATTIRNWDRKDYIVPNKDIITGRLLNWTLSDEVTRIVINVGVAYGTDTERAKKILIQVAQDHPTVVDEPAPSATFEEFGDSSLGLVLRCYIAMSDMSQRLTVVDELYTVIDEQFKQAKIEIAFPQQDIHIRGMPPDLLDNAK